MNWRSPMAVPLTLATLLVRGSQTHRGLRRDEYDRLKAILTNCVRNGPDSQNRQYYTTSVLIWKDDGHGWRTFTRNAAQSYATCSLSFDGHTTAARRLLHFNLCGQTLGQLRDMRNDANHPPIGPQKLDRVQHHLHRLVVERRKAFVQKQ